MVYSGVALQHTNFFLDTPWKILLYLSKTYITRIKTFSTY